MTCLVHLFIEKLSAEKTRAVRDVIVRYSSLAFHLPDESSAKSRRPHFWIKPDVVVMEGIFLGRLKAKQVGLNWYHSSHPSWIMSLMGQMVFKNIN